MELTGFLGSLADFATSIDLGRKGLMTDGGEREGRIGGISGALAAFRQAARQKRVFTDAG